VKYPRVSEIFDIKNLWCPPKLGRLRVPDRNAWWAGLWPAGRMLDTRALEHCSIS